MEVFARIKWIGTVLLLVGLTAAMTTHRPADEDYRKAITLAENAVLKRKIARDSYALISVQKTLAVNRLEVDSGGIWEVRYLSRNLLSKEGWVMGKGGGMSVTVNIKTGFTEVRGLE